VPSLPNPISVAVGTVRWGQALANEVARAPQTLRTARHVIEDMQAVPRQIDALTRELETTLRALALAVSGGMTDNLEHLDTVVSDLGRTLTALIGGIPGARRALRGSDRPTS
jgi:hypothetical protein